MNIGEIAKMAGVSSAAVSRYFNNGSISDEKKEAIRRVVEETGYRPSVQAQTLRTKRTKMIGVIVPKIASASIGRMVEGILGILNESGYQMLLAVTQNNPEKELEYLDALGQKQVDGVILAATVYTQAHEKALRELEVPLVIAGQKVPGVSCVFHDDYHAAYDLTCRILQAGRRNLGYMGAIREDQAVGGERLRGYQDAVRKSGLGHLADHVVTASFRGNSAYEKAGELLDTWKGLDCIVAATDTMAVGVRNCLWERKISVPEQVLVAGFGDSYMDGVMIPPLATVRYFYEECGKRAAQLLVKQMSAGEEGLHAVRLGYELVNVG